jgi:hypothetical protein
MTDNPKTWELLKSQSVKNFLPTPTAELKPKEVAKRLGAIQALGMISVLFVFLASIYTSQEPYRFRSSNLALQRALHIPELSATESLDIAGIWHWMKDVISRVGGDTVNSIAINCAYGDNIQIVPVDGFDYEVVDPNHNSNSCSQENMKHIDGKDEVTYLAGSHQLLAFGVFTKRSVPHAPIEGSVRDTDTLLEIPSDDIHSIDPAHDHKVADVCHVDVKDPSGEFNDTICVLIDGFEDEIGTSLNWPGINIIIYYLYPFCSFPHDYYCIICMMFCTGRVVKSSWDGHKYYAFEPGSSATLFRHHNYETAYPCYSYRNYTSATGECIVVCMVVYIVSALPPCKYNLNTPFSVRQRGI